VKTTTNVQTGYLCHCLRITSGRFEEILDEMPQPTFPALKSAHGIGSLCSSCEYEAKGVLQEYLMLHPQKAQPPRPPQSGLRRDLGVAWGQIKQRVKGAGMPTADRSKSGAPKTYHTGIFFMRRAGLESHLVVSNLAFPEHPANANGPAATFRATLFGDSGEKLAVSAPVTITDGQTLELTPADLFPTVTGEFTGGLYVDYESLVQTGSLRPYGVLLSTVPDFRARCHYHDKFGAFTDPGFFQNTSPFEPGQTCWMALANCQPLPYETTVFAKFGGRRIDTRLSVEPMGSRWLKLADLFPDLDTIPVAERSPALFALENPQHVMVYFYWFNEAARTWMGQHH